MRTSGNGLKASLMLIKYRIDWCLHERVGGCLSAFDVYAQCVCEWARVRGESVMPTITADFYVQHVMFSMLHSKSSNKGTFCTFRIRMLLNIARRKMCPSNGKMWMSTHSVIHVLCCVSKIDFREARESESVCVCVYMSVREIKIIQTVQNDWYLNTLFYKNVSTNCIVAHRTTKTRTRTRITTQREKNATKFFVF